MSAPRREGGRHELPDGGRVIWSVAEGRRGRRWRWVLDDDRGLVVVLLETDPGGAPTRLEVSAAAGLLTLHPEPPGREAHGNVVGPSGVRPLAFAWGPGHRFDVVDLPWVLGACGDGGAAGETSRRVLRVDRALRVIEADGALAGASASPAGPPEPAGSRWPLE